MTNVLVTGGKGQLASCIKDIADNLNDLDFIYVDHDELDITKKEEIETFFQKKKIAYCVNCAAYTAVDKAETEKDLAKSVNVDGARFLAEACSEHNTVFIQISTDFVFDGKGDIPYKESDKTNPLGVYGRTKLESEKAVSSAVREHFIIRTSWLYSEHGHNFLKTMLRLGAERDKLNVVGDQIGTPTYAGDLAELIVKIIREDTREFGTYHYSNEGVASWYDFAKAIMDESKRACKVFPIKTEAYPTPARRPTFSVMDKSKVKNTLEMEIPHWRDSLKKCLSILQNND